MTQKINNIVNNTDNKDYNTNAKLSQNVVSNMNTGIDIDQQELENHFDNIAMEDIYRVASELAAQANESARKSLEMLEKLENLN